MSDIGAAKALIRDVPDFPKPGIVFKDITPVLANADAFTTVIDLIVDRHAGTGIDHVMGIEARGFIIAAPIAYRLGAGFVPARKAGKLPGHTLGVAYELEYGSEILEVHSDALVGGRRVLIVDDVLATGGTAAAAVDLVHQCGAQVAGCSFVIELEFLNGRAKLPGVDLQSLITY